MACYNFDKHKPIVILFGRYVADKVSNQKLLYFATSPNHSVSALPCKTLKRKKSNVLLKCCITALPVLLLATRTHAAVRLPKSHCQWS